MNTEKAKQIKTKFLKEKFAKEGTHKWSSGMPMSYDDVMLLLETLIKEWPSDTKK